MDQDIIQTTVIALASLMLFYRAQAKRKPQSLFVGVILLIFGLTRWPLFLPLSTSLGLMAFCSAAFMLFEKITGKRLNIGYYQIVLLIGFGMVFLSDYLFGIKLL